MRMRRVCLLCWLVTGVILLRACAGARRGEPTLPPASTELSHTDLAMLTISSAGLMSLPAQCLSLRPVAAL